MNFPKIIKTSPSVFTSCTSLTHMEELTNILDKAKLYKLIYEMTKENKLKWQYKEEYQHGILHNIYSTKYDTIFRSFSVKIDYTRGSSIYGTYFKIDVDASNSYKSVSKTYIHYQRSESLEYYQISSLIELIKSQLDIEFDKLKESLDAEEGNLKTLLKNISKKVDNLIESIH